MWRSLSLLVFILGGFVAFALFSSSKVGQSDDTNRKVAQGGEKLPQKVYSIALDKEYIFAEELVPVADNFDVRERLDRELLRNAYWHSNTVVTIKRAARYFPVIEPILAEEGIPDDFKYLAVAESDLSNAVSPAGAKGVWQFMKATGKEYGLEANSEIDERYHLEKSTRAACRYLKSLKKRFGSWTMAAAAYNMGGGRLKKEFALQRGTSYYDLNLNQETSRYVFRIMAIKEIMGEPEKYGFYIEDADKYPPLDKFYEVEIKESVANWGDFAKKYGTTYRMLKVYNPWLVKASLTNKSRKTYLVKVPKEE